MRMDVLMKPGALGNSQVQADRDVMIIPQHQGMGCFRPIQ